MIRQIVAVGALLLCMTGCSVGRSVLYSPQGSLPHVTPPMQTAGYWISRHPEPDRLVMRPDEVEAFNRRVRDDLGLIRDIRAVPSVLDADEVIRQLEQDEERFHGRPFYEADGYPAGDDFFWPVMGNTARDRLSGQVTTRYGLVLRPASQRFLPTDRILTAQPGDIDFDELQNNTMDIGTPVVVVHTSRDGRWVYTYGPLLDGWVRSANIGIYPQEEVTGFMEHRPFAVVTAARADIFLDPRQRRYVTTARMGTRLPWVAEQDGTVEVRIPAVDEEGRAVVRSAYLSVEDVSKGYLPYTPRVVLRQAFKLIHAPYGWGGMYGGQDCSRFLRQVFATVGVQLPRNSSDQDKAGVRAAAFDKNTFVIDKKVQLLQKGMAGVSLLPMPGHIMLYLGQTDERPYAIHAAWAYREPAAGRDERVYVLNRVIVSDLSLGENSRRGSLWERLTGIVNIVPVFGDEP